MASVSMHREVEVVIPQGISLSDAKEALIELFDLWHTNYQHVHNGLETRFGSYLFTNVGFCKVVELVLSETFDFPQALVEEILQSWFPDSTLRKAGFSHLAE